MIREYGQSKGWLGKKKSRWMLIDEYSIRVQPVSKLCQDVPSTAKLKCPPGLGAGVVS
jgi:hypothetical protein